mgnify:CR=1 FL=1
MNNIIHLKNQPGWQNSAMFYQIYPMGFCGAPYENDGRPQSRIRKVIDWVEHLKALNTGAVYFSPVFESDTHGYDTRDFRKIDTRLGTNQDFADVCNALHKAGIRVVLDGVFNHVGRGFWAFQDVLKNREGSAYKDWFHINFGGNSGYNDGLWYEGWEGHYELVKLNLQNPAVVSHVLECVDGWITQFGIDGLRLDVAYLLDENFLRQLHDFCKGKDPGFFLLGEMIHGDYRRIMNPQMLDSVTNYECYKGLYSSFNDKNMFEIAHSLNRQFGSENWCLYRGEHLLCFADNHDVTRIHTILKEKEQLFGLYAMLYCMPGIPCLYYGSEWCADGDKKDGDPALRPCFEKPVQNELTKFIGQLSRIKLHSKALAEGSYKNETLLNKQIVIRREAEGETVVAAINADGADFTVGCGCSGPAVDLFTGEAVELHGSIFLPPYGVKIYRLGAPRDEDKPLSAPELILPLSPAPKSVESAVTEDASKAIPANETFEIEFRTIEHENLDAAEAFIKSRLDSCKILLRGAAINLTNEPAIGAFNGDQLVGLGVYKLQGDICELLFLGSTTPHQRIGMRILDLIRQKSRENGCKKISLVLSNDRLTEMAYYQKRGFDMVRIYHNSLKHLSNDTGRKGQDGIAVLHEIEFEADLEQ